MSFLWTVVMNNIFFPIVLTLEKIKVKNTMLVFKIILEILLYIQVQCLNSLKSISQSKIL